MTAVKSGSSLRRAKSPKRTELIGKSGIDPVLCYGYSYNGGVLRPAPAVYSTVATGLSARDFYGVSYHPAFGGALFLFSSGGAAFKRFSDAEAFALPAFSPSIPFAVEARDKNGAPIAAIVSGSVMRVFASLPSDGVSYNLPYSLYGGVAHCGRLFAADYSDRLTLRWSGLRIVDWTAGIEGSGYLSLEGAAGRILALENFGDDLLCVREHGFTTVKALADSRNFRIAPSQFTAFTAGAVNVGGAVGGKYFFTQTDGVYSYDGAAISKEYAAGGALAGCGRAYAAGDGMLYVECTYGGASCLMRFDPQSKQAVFFGLGCKHPFRLKDELYCVKGESFYTLSSSNSDSQRLWRAVHVGAELGGGACGRKTLKRLEVYGSGNLSLTVTADDVSRAFSGFGAVYVGMRGRDFSVEIRGDGTAERVWAQFEVEG